MPYRNVHNILRTEKTDKVWPSLVAVMFPERDRVEPGEGPVTSGSWLPNMWGRS